jgi:hypothetical protein
LAIELKDMIDSVIDTWIGKNLQNGVSYPTFMLNGHIIGRIIKAALMHEGMTITMHIQNWIGILEIIVNEILHGVEKLWMIAGSLGMSHDNDTIGVDGYMLTNHFHDPMDFVSEASLPFVGIVNAAANNIESKDEGAFANKEKVFNVIGLANELEFVVIPSRIQVEKIWRYGKAGSMSFARGDSKRRLFGHPRSKAEPPIIALSIHIQHDVSQHVSAIRVVLVAIVRVVIGTAQNRFMDCDWVGPKQIYGLRLGRPLKWWLCLAIGLVTMSTFWLPVAPWIILANGRRFEPLDALPAARRWIALIVFEKTSMRNQLRPYVPLGRDSYFALKRYVYWKDNWTLSLKLHLRTIRKRSWWAIGIWPEGARNPRSNILKKASLDFSNE